MAGLADNRPFGTKLYDNFVGIDDQWLTPGEKFGSLANTFGTALMNPIDTLKGAGGAIQAATDNLNNLMFEGGAMERPEDVFTDLATTITAPGLLRTAAKGAINPAVISAGGAGPSRQASEEVLDLLKSHQPGKVTDDMLSRADDAYLFRHYPLPMDPASRMDRAAGIGNTSLGYRGSPVDPAAFKDVRPYIFASDSPYVANSYAKGAGSASITMPQGTPTVAPLLINEGKSLHVNANGRGFAHLPYDSPVTPDGRTLRDVVGDEAATWKVNGNWTTDSDALPMAAIGNRGYDSVVFNDMVDRGSEAYFDYEKHVIDLGEGKTHTYYSGKPNKEQSRLSSQPSRVTAVRPENVRSLFARFDPRLAHLRNLSAGGAAGAFGLSQTMGDAYEENY